MLIALLLLVVQSLAAQPAALAAGPLAHAHALVASATMERATMERAENVAGDASSTRTAERSVRSQESRHATVWVRAPYVVGHVAPSRAASTPPTLPPADASTARLSVEAAFAASVRVRTLDDSHEVSGRGALLPYYPTAPPLQG
jgi:hypothetical protein